MNDPLTYDADRRVILDQNGLAVARDVGAADAIRITEALSICADLPPVLRDAMTTHVYDLDQGDVIEPDNPLEDFARRAENVTADEPKGAPPVAKTEPLFALLDELLAYKAEAFANDTEVNGADLVDAFVSFRARIRIALEDRRAAAAFAPPPIGLLEIAGDLSASIEGLDHQIEQMKGVFPDDDGAIRQAQDDGDEARKRLDLYRKACGAPTPAGLLPAVVRLYEACGEEHSEEEDALANLPASINEALADVIRFATEAPERVNIIVTMDGGLIDRMSTSRLLPGVEVTVIDFDTEGADMDRISQVQTGDKYEGACVSRYDMGCPGFTAIVALPDIQGGEE